MVLTDNCTQNSPVCIQIGPCVGVGNVPVVVSGTVSHKS